MSFVSPKKAKIQREKLKPASFKDFDDFSVSELDCSGYPITSFEGIGNFKNLRKLDVRNTKICSFRGVEAGLCVEELFIQGTQLSFNLCFMEMAVLAFGDSLQFVDEASVTKYRYLLNNNDEYQELVRKGFLISSIDGNSICMNSFMGLKESSDKMEKMEEILDQIKNDGICNASIYPLYSNRMMMSSGFIKKLHEYADCEEKMDLSQSLFDQKEKHKNEIRVLEMTIMELSNKLQAQDESLKAGFKELLKMVPSAFPDIPIDNLIQNE